jgi:chloride channel protein, CIC family
VPSEDPLAEPPPPAGIPALYSRGYLTLLLVAGLIGIPISVIAFGFLAAVHELEHLVWDSLPSELGYDIPPAWWPIAALGLAGVLVALTVTRLPGHGGHVPAEGLAVGATPTSHLPGVALAAGASLALGAVVGPEAPLIALGSGLALLSVRWFKEAEPGHAVIAAAGSAAAISAIFGNPLVAAVIFLEAVGLARRQALLVLLPCLVSTGVGALVFTGLGNWTGWEINELAIPGLESVRLEVTDLLWTLPLAAAVAVTMFGVFVVGRKTASLAAARTIAATIAVGLVAGCIAAVYAVVTDHSPTEVALSGQATLATLVTEPGQWTTGALALLLLCKAAAYAVCIGVFRGGPIFPAIFVGATFGVLAGALAPGLAAGAGVAIGMAAGAAVMRLPIAGVLLVVLVLGDAARELMPVVILAVVTALVIDELLTSRAKGSAVKVG